MSTLETIGVLIVESGAPDARGLPVLIGAEPSHWVAAQGSQVAPHLFIMAEEEADEAFAPVGSAVTLRFTATAPSGEVVFVNQMQMRVEPKLDPELPRRYQVLVPLVFTADEQGLYTLTAAATAPANKQVWKRKLLLRFA